MQGDDAVAAGGIGELAGVILCFRAGDAVPQERQLFLADYSRSVGADRRIQDSDFVADKAVQTFCSLEVALIGAGSLDDRVVPEYGTAAFAELLREVVEYEIPESQLESADAVAAFGIDERVAQGDGQAVFGAVPFVALARIDGDDGVLVGAAENLDVVRHEAVSTRSRLVHALVDAFGLDNGVGVEDFRAVAFAESDRDGVGDEVVHPEVEHHGAIAAGGVFQVLGDIGGLLIDSALPRITLAVVDYGFFGVR